MLTYNIRVYGIVQGVGFRPFVSRTCKENGIKGTVANKGSYVEIFAQGEEECVNKLLGALNNSPPERSNILNIISHECETQEFDSFEIIESEKDVGDIFVSPDIAICDKCKKELYDPKNRRYMHPFINCTNCGPRLTILDSMPYDRERTSMKDFKMCPECEYEYTHPETRRYDAQPVCCPDCGPKVYLLKTGLSDGNTGKVSERISEGEEAITAARRALSEGKIVAIKGIGGFHLACDAKNEEAVSRLRLLKHRPMKPFAVMMKNMDTVLRECILSEEANALGKEIDSRAKSNYLTGYQKPIVLLSKKNEGSLADSVAPDNPNVGVMLPYTPLHMLLFEYLDEYEVSDCLVMTSANASGAPICRTDEDALSEISGFTDYILSNDRVIRTRADDSVMDFYAGKPYMIRRSRGFAPLPVMLGDGTNKPLKGCVLAVGGELKNTFAIAKDSLIYPSAYVGDMEDIRTVSALEESIVRMETLLEAKPTAVVCDLHPKYNTTAVAESLGLPVIKVQHHYAHILSCMAENDYLDEVLGVSFDGTGYGTDGTIWGGEFLRCRVDGFERLGHIKPFIQSGGDLSSKEGWRIAASILGHFEENNDTNETDEGDKSAVKICESLGICSPMEYSLLKNMAKTGVNSILSTSAGRLFDAVSAVLGIRRSSTFEGEASTALMFEAQKYLKSNSGEKCKNNYSVRSLDYDTNKVVNDIAGRYLDGGDKAELAFYFHYALAEIIMETCRKLSSETGLKTVALSGGVFQNKILLRLTEDMLRQHELKVIRHSLIPPNDGGICVGQALVGMISNEC
ncbi:MAG: carbamoyltransferase HypF [Eubacterium sp.]|nr:carbamoyltransferase HypF [Eubacterium sp.]